MKVTRFTPYIICFIFLAVSAYAQELKASPPKIGMLLPLSGSYASGGVDNQQGVEAALSLTNQAALFKVIYSDSRADATTGISEFRKLTDTDNVLAVFVMRGTVGMAINPISLNSKIPVLGAVGNKNFAATNQYAFQAWSKLDDEGAFLAKKLQDHGYHKVALLTVQDDWQGAVSDEFRKVFPASILFDQEVVPSNLDFRSELSRIKALAPEVIFANLALAQIGPFMRQAKELNLNAKIYSNFWVAKKEVLDSVGAALLEGVRYVEMDTELPKLQKLINEKYSATVSGATLSAYASTLLLAQVIGKNPQITTRAELYAALLKQTQIETSDGPIAIVDRCIKFPLVEKTIQGGKVTAPTITTQ